MNLAVLPGAAHTHLAEATARALGVMLGDVVLADGDDGRVMAFRTAITNTGRWIARSPKPPRGHRAAPKSRPASSST